MFRENWFPAISPKLFYKPSAVFLCLKGPLYPRGFHSFTLMILLTGALGLALIDLRNSGWEQMDTEPLVSGLFLLFLIIMRVSMFLLVWYLGKVMIFRLTPSFGGTILRPEVWKLIVTCNTPFLVVQPFAVLNFAADWIGFAGLAYSVFLFYQGVSYLHIVPAHRRIGFTLVSFFILLGTSYIVTKIILGFINFA